MLRRSCGTGVLSSSRRLISLSQVFATPEYLGRCQRSLEELETFSVVDSSKRWLSFFSFKANCFEETKTWRGSTNFITTQGWNNSFSRLGYFPDFRRRNTDFVQNDYISGTMTLSNKKEYLHQRALQSMEMLSSFLIQNLNTKEPEELGSNFVALVSICIQLPLLTVG